MCADSDPLKFNVNVAHDQIRRIHPLVSASCSDTCFGFQEQRRVITVKPVKAPLRVRGPTDLVH